jgi:ribosome biogenesis GTPase YqeH
MEKNRVQTCFGCGVPLQNENPGATGYVPKMLGENGQEHYLCQRCYRLQHYGETREEEVALPDYKEIFSNAIKKKCLIIYVVDLFAFECSIIKDLSPFIKDNPILVVANKRDIMPKSIDDDKLRQFVYARFKLEGIDIEDVIVSSAYKNYNIEEIIEAMKALKNGKDIYIVGASSVGKSSLINVLLKNIKNETRDLITTSPYPGTTVATITIPLDNKSKIYDTPGMVSRDSVFAAFDKSVLKYTIPRTEIKPITFQLNDKQSIFIGGVSRFDFVEGKKTGFTFYASSNVELHRTKLEKADAIFEKLISTGKIKPVSAALKGPQDFVRHEMNLPNDKKVDIVISGLAWISVKGTGQKVSVLAPAGVSVTIRDPKI